MINTINLDDKTIKIQEDTILYFLETFPILDFDPNKIKLFFIDRFAEQPSDSTIITTEVTPNHELSFSYSLDGRNYSNYISIENFITEISILEDVTLYLSIKIKLINIDKSEETTTLYIDNNVDSRQKSIELFSIEYDENIIYFDKIKFQTIYELINQYPKWNFYDNQQVTIRRWLDQCNTIAEMYGHVCIYFKTEPIESETIHTFANHPMRNVIDIKKMSIVSPDNELPQDRSVYSEWDMPLQDDFMINIIDEKFKQAFGDVIPSEKDYLYLPIINKMFRVAAVQPKNGFMGVIGWWEVFLSKYEDDDSIGFTENLQESIMGIPELSDAVEHVNSQILNELGILKDDTVNSVDKIKEVTIEEKKSVNQNFTNKLSDTTNYISLKETEKHREFFNNRLTIVSINPSTSAFPITMYQNSSVEKHQIAIQYNLIDYTVNNKFSLITNQEYKITFNYVLLVNFVGEIFDIVDDEGLSYLTIKNNRKYIEFVDNYYQQTFKTDFPLDLNEIYYIEINYIIGSPINMEIEPQILTAIPPQIAIKIFSLDSKTKEKAIKFQNIYIINMEGENYVNPEINKINLYGGDFLSSEIFFDIDDKTILKDYTNPIMETKKF